MTKKENDFTSSNHQASLGIKAALALMVNNIVTPIIVNAEIEKNMYDEGGLVNDVFFLGITNSVVPVLIKIFDYRYYPKRVRAWWMKKP